MSEGDNQTHDAQNNGNCNNESDEFHTNNKDLDKNNEIQENINGTSIDEEEPFPGYDIFQHCDMFDDAVPHAFDNLDIIDSDDDYVEYDDTFLDFETYSSDEEEEFLTPLGNACKGKDYQKVEDLLKAGADINEKFGANNQTVLHYAVLNNDKKVTELLLHYNADSNALDKFHRTPLLLACIPENSLLPEILEVIKLLLDWGCDIDSQDCNGNTPLHVCKSVQILKVLLINDPNLNLKNENGKTAFELYNLPDPALVMSKVYTSCLDEIKQIKEIKLNFHYSLRDFLFMPLLEARRYSINETILTILGDAGTFETRFSIYGLFLDSKYQKAKFRKNLHDQAHQTLNFFSNINIPHLCCEELFTYFNNHELKKIVDAKKELKIK